LVTVYVIFQFDTEDFVTPEADDVLLDLTRILERFGVKASFCIVGEKARELERRGRFDVISALRKHDIAYQSDLHSVHPTIPEYLADEDWDEGVKKVIKNECSGLDDVTRIFGVTPSGFIQPGGSWAPQVPYAIRTLGVRVYADGIFESEPVWFCNNLCLKASMHLPEHSTMDDLASLKERFDKLYNLKRESGGLIVIFSHPCMFITEDFWDTVNFSGGKNTPKERYATPILRRREAYKESLRVFQRFLSHILEYPEVSIVTFREVPSLYGEPKERTPNLDQIFRLARNAASSNDWQIVDGKSISSAEVLRLLMECVAKYLCRGVEPSFVPVHPTLGPTSKPFKLHVRKRVKMADLLQLCHQAIEFVENHDRIPPAITVKSVTFGPSDLLEATAKVVAYYSRYRRLPANVEIGGNWDLPMVVQRWNLIDRIKSQWSWTILPEGFASRRIEELTIWQAWTVRPAIFGGKGLPARS